MKKRLKAALAGAAVLLAVAPQARADEANVPAQIKIMLDAAGGTYDLYARLVSRHWGNKLPGNPKIVVEYMPGNSGTRVLNYLYTVAPRDGSVFGSVSSGMPASAATAIAASALSAVSLSIATHETPGQCRSTSA